jgi:NADPH-dependent ferric siderophore reductase
MSHSPQLRRNLVVRATRLVTPLMRRIIFGGDGLAGMEGAPPAAWIKLFIPTGSGDQAGRAYTVRRYDAAARELAVDFVIHGDGPASRWAERAAPGDVVQFGGPRSGFERRPDAEWLLLAGDETALPAILGILESLPPATHALAFVEIDHTEEQQAVKTAAPVEMTWLSRDGAPAGTTNLLETATRRAPLPAGHGQFWLAGEAGVTRRIRGQLTEERGIPMSAVTAKGYWKIGEVDHRDRQS